MFRNVKKEVLVTVLGEIGETVDPGINLLDLKQKLMQSKAYLEDEKFVKDILATTVEDRKKEEKREEYRKKEEEYRKKEEENRRKAEERRLEREHELALARIGVTRDIESRSPRVHSNGEVSIDKLMKAVCRYASSGNRPVERPLLSDTRNTRVLLTKPADGGIGGSGGAHEERKVLAICFETKERTGEKTPPGRQAPEWLREKTNEPRGENGAASDLNLEAEGEYSNDLKGGNNYEDAVHSSSSVKLRIEQKCLKEKRCKRREEQQQFF
ncbi:hypothetical protein TNCT_597961 [Trichonephila clavata]|uniref:Uncharacterized protein n=1 Tax=Trichonephila clavata TaxID=2740835 RepID=A0A8X6I7K6_TRICU|nr:hypothetical protein TNCT_597961 [Trichonephila clavata]